jgi:phage head maturation protease
MSTMVDERRAFQIRDVEVDTGRKQLSGIAVPYDTPADIGWFMETFVAGSLAKSIKEAARSLPLTLFHEDHVLDSHIGVAREWIDDRGALRGVWDLDDSVTARRAAQLATPDEDGNAVLGYMSIRFAPIRSEWEYAKDFNPDLGPAFKDRVRRLEARLLAVSLVSTPAFKEAAVEWVRSGERARERKATRRDVDTWREELSRLR